MPVELVNEMELWNSVLESILAADWFRVPGNVILFLKATEKHCLKCQENERKCRENYERAALHLKVAEIERLRLTGLRDALQQFLKEDTDSPEIPF